MTLTPEDVSARELADAMKRLIDVQTPAAQFYVKPFEAYTLVAVLQACSRHPALSDRQRTIVVDFGRQIATQLYAMAAAILGQPNIVQDSLEMGFHVEHDRGPEFRLKDEVR